MAEGDDKPGISEVNLSPDLTSSPDSLNNLLPQSDGCEPEVKTPRVKRAYKKRASLKRNQSPETKVPKINFALSDLEAVTEPVVDRTARRRAPRRLRMKEKDFEADVPSVNVLRMTASRHISTKGRSSCTHSYRQLAGFMVRGPRPQKTEPTNQKYEIEEEIKNQLDTVVEPLEDEPVPQRKRVYTRRKQKTNIKSDGSRQKLNPDLSDKKSVIVISTGHPKKQNDRKVEIAEFEDLHDPVQSDEDEENVSESESIYAGNLPPQLFQDPPPPEDELVVKENNIRLLKKEFEINGVLTNRSKSETTEDVSEKKSKRRKNCTKKSSKSDLQNGSANVSEKGCDDYKNIIAAIETVASHQTDDIEVKNNTTKSTSVSPQNQFHEEFTQDEDDDDDTKQLPPVEEQPACKILPRHSKLIPPKLVYKDLLKVAPVKHLPDRLAKRKWTNSSNNRGPNHTDVNTFNTVGCFKLVTVRRFNSYTQICLPTDSASSGTLTISVLKELVTAIHSVQLECSKCLVLSGSGSYFSSGIDLQYIINDKTKCNALKMAEAVRDFIQCLINFPKPVIAAVNGPAIGLGAAFLPLCDIVYASDKSWFYTPYGRLGQTPEGCSSYTFPKLGTLFANDMLYGNRKITAREACQRGLVSQVFWPETFMHDVTERVRTMASCPAKSLQACKALIKYGLKEELLEVNERESTLLFERWTASDCQNAIKLYLDKFTKET